jgi:pre-mRNA-splicing factor ATP-dependent RNA helicase DHX15/PRP43
MERNDLELVSTPFEDPTYYTNIRRALTSGFFMQVAKKAQGAKHYTTIKDQQLVTLHPSTVLETLPEWVIYNEYVSLLHSFTSANM